MKANQKPLAKDIITKLLRVAKLQSMEEIYDRVRPGPDSRIRTDLSPVGTDTGRFSSKGTFLEVSTNLQNIPKKTAKLDPLFDVRSVMVPDPGYVFIESDLSQAESRIVAAYAGDKRTLDLFESGADIHAITAAGIFNCKEEDVDWTKRHLGKTARHAFERGMGWQTFMGDVNKDADLTGVAISPKKAKEISEGFHRTNAYVKRWWKEIELEVKDKGYLISSFGRKRIFIDWSNTRAWVSFLPQAEIADHLNSILVEVFASLDGPDFMALLQIHDAILGQSPVGVHLREARKLHRLMSKSIEINHTTVPIPADIAVSRTNWAEMRELNL